MKLTKILGYLGLLASILVGLGEYFLHYSPEILGHAADYEFFKYVPLEHLTTGHFLAVIGLPFYFAGYIHIYRMLKSGNEMLARLVLAIGFIAFAVGGIWIGSRASIGHIVHLKDAMDASTYQHLLTHYTDHMEVLVQALRVIIATLSVVFVVAILKGGTYYRKWMAIFNPIVILLLVFSTMFWASGLAKHLAPIAMNVTHFILFTLSLYQLKTKSHEIH
ncbi:hypothetical protein ITJ86_11820 [Winogradskyella sp. F6397]|uniref:DUF4386 family protein n=1 Tax=Winogradskyella marina TaxID=2785530 RepID=A0ABS0EJE5_9FLAO|nr:DUF6796 family protein [Winogradskyella marina]MBF8150589.1 hypothetical protein [Winogradskyella marina]